MSRSDRERLRDIEVACEAITSYVAREGLDEDIFFDTTHSVVLATATRDIPTLRLAVRRILARRQ
jgi:hypothetical protein